VRSNTGTNRKSGGPGQVSKITSYSAPVSTASRVSNLGRMRTMELSRSLINRYGSGIRVTGSEYIGPVGSTFSSEQLQGYDVFYLDLTPSLWAGTRVQIQSQLWEKWKPNYIKFKYVPTCPTSTSGSFLAFADYDWNDEVPPTSVIGIRTAASFEPSAEFSVFKAGPDKDYELIYRDLPGRRTADSYYTGDPNTAPDPRLCAAGWFDMKCLENMTGNSRTFYGHVIIDYDIDFYVAANEQGQPMTGPTNSNNWATTTETAGAAFSLLLQGTNPLASVANQIIKFTPTSSLPIGSSNPTVQANVPMYGLVDTTGQNIIQVYKNLQQVFSRTFLTNSTSYSTSNGIPFTWSSIA
jgi:hypothetical protein